jgi:Domain of unknown function (DUF6438)
MAVVQPTPLLLQRTASCLTVQVSCALKGTHTEIADPSDVRRLAEKFVAADFYSMDDAYRASVTDLPACLLSIDIDGHKKNVEDYAGSWVGMPALITELEDEVDTFARTKRWIGNQKY